MAPLRFAANLDWLFLELPALPERLEAAGRAGFRAAEVPGPFAWDPALLRGAADRAGVGLVLINTPPGDQDKGEKGFGAVPGCQAKFREDLALAVKYAKALGCPRIHIMAGRVPAGAERAAVAVEMEATFIENLRHAADILVQEDMVGLLEPMNSRVTDPHYFLTTPHQAGILEKVGRPNLQLQLDIFHCQIMDGNLTQNLEMYFPITGHIQIGQVPGRHEPDSPGEVNFPYLFQLLESLGYKGYVGCEYAPQGDTLEGLGWLRAYWASQGLQQHQD
ncbi:putative hydroxypyruvate isomerase isoform X2 [Carettochelys insculpta]|uniref:putative hydroxypyruvate isomerase isoform X2 n=1 Tax=Carettochelys insculpta TaxID=44489 RepID=UPI003EB9099D